jgi:hypothetical protein
MNEEALTGQVYVCMACGKRSKDIYGFKKISRGWDESCMLNALLCYEDKLKIENECVVDILEGGRIK